ncbi:DNA translocase FtsK 4TM domain-containing protein, partial [Anaerotignum faecicola]|nr:DNA translocase FtsK 4TM domain-containing protein [Anaerotignum faecicola]
GAFLLPIASIGFCIWIILKREHDFAWVKVIGLAMFILGIAAMFQMIFDSENLNLSNYGFMETVSLFYKEGSGLNGGLFGGLIALGLKSSIGWGSYIVLMAIIIIGLMLSTGKSLFTGIESIADAVS